MTPEHSLANQFLIAMPGLAGSYFGDALIYLCEHNQEGALGLVVNRPSELSLIELLAQLGMPPHGLSSDVPVLDGGPVARDRGFILHSADRHFDASVDLGDGLMLTASREVLEAVAEGEGPQHFLVTLGYAGWGGGQLEEELKDNAWLSCPVPGSVRLEVLFDAPFETRARQAAAELGVDLRLFSGQAGHA